MATTNPLSSINTSLNHGTPPRERHTTHRLEANSNNSSPATLRSVSSFSNPNSSNNNTNNNNSNHNTQAVTIEGLLAAHSNASNPPLAALDVAVTDRNALGAQNAQLWKLMEKQRTGYGQLLKELERIRGERDVYRARLQSLGENTDSLLRSHRDREKREGKESALRSAASHSHLRNGEHGGAAAVPSAVGSSSNLDSRAHMMRANSDDIGTIIALFSLSFLQLMHIDPCPCSLNLTLEFHLLAFQDCVLTTRAQALHLAQQTRQSIANGRHHRTTQLAQPILHLHPTSQPEPDPEPLPLTHPPLP